MQSTCRTLDPMQAETDAPSPRRRRWPLLALVLGAPLVVLGLQVDDWSRDLTTNVAETAAGHADARLLPLRVARPLAEVQPVLREVAEAQPALRFAGEEDGRLRFERTSALFGFVDDVWLWAEPAGEGCLIQARAQSRVGKGDLGQNPRTLDALLRALEAELGDDAQPLRSE